jgi:ABC-type sugar transport system ATPase subunit
MAIALDVETPRVSMRRISKRFGGVQALSDVGLDVRRGSIHALLGENGAGKSTLVKILTGAVRADAGTILVGGQEVHITSPVVARRLGIGAVHQELNLFPDLTVLENVFVGDEPHDRLGFVQHKRMAGQLAEEMGAVGWKMDVSRSLESLSLAERQMVEILRAFHKRADLILLDEPNSALTDAETRALFAMMKRFQARGQSFLLVSHRLDEVFRISDHITILRDGRRVASGPAGKFNVADAVQLMVGSTASSRGVKEYRSVRGSTVRLGLAHVTSRAFRDITLTVHPGEIVGFAGLEGAGVQDLFAALFGLQRTSDGTISLEGEPYAPRNSAQAIARGVASIPADRRSDSLLMDRSVGENIVLVVLRRIKSALGFVSRRRMESTANEFAEAFRVRAPSLDTPVVQLSGGNQQKVVLARWLAASPRLLILNDPCRGIDVGAKREVHDAIRRLAASGMSILLWSSEAEETLSLCDRVVVMRKGRLVKEVDPATTSLNELLLAITGEPDLIRQ